MRDTQEIRFAVLMFPNFPLMAFSSVIEPLRAANTLSGRRCYSWLTVAAGEKISASNGIGIEPDFHVRNAPEVDRIVVCSGGDAEHLVADEEMAWIRKNLRAGAQLGAVADAAFFLARKGCSTATPARSTGPASRPSRKRSRISTCARTSM